MYLTRGPDGVELAASPCVAAERAHVEVHHGILVIVIARPHLIPNFSRSPEANNPGQAVNHDAVSMRTRGETAVGQMDLNARSSAERYPFLSVALRNQGFRFGGLRVTCQGE